MNEDDGEKILRKLYQIDGGLTVICVFLGVIIGILLAIYFKGS